MKNILVADIMTREPVTISPDSSLLDCAKRMVKKKVGSLLITDRDKRLLGFISEKDILWAMVKKSREDLAKVRAIDISPKKIITVKPDFTIKETIDRIKKTKFEKLPVVLDNRLVGVITIKDILNFNPEVYPEIEEFAKIREESEKLKRIKNAAKKGDGICEECGHEGLLFKVDGMLVCESCRDSV